MVLAKRGSTLFLRAVIMIMALGALALAIFGLPALYRGGSAEYPTATLALKLIVSGLYVAAVPFFIVLWQTLQLLRYIDENKAYSDVSLRALTIIRNCAIVIAALFIGGVPLLYPIAQADDAPGLLVVGMAIAGMPLVVAVFAAVLKKLLHEALAIKSENDLTV